MRYEPRPQHPIKGFLAALGAVAVLSIMDAVMKHLVLAVGLVAVSVWRSAANLSLSCLLYLPRREHWPIAVPCASMLPAELSSL